MYVNARAIIEREVEGEPAILVQTRDKPGQAPVLELPGGQVEEYESLVDALRREVREETGLRLTEIEGTAARVLDRGEGTTVECIRPFGVYQTLSGPVDSMGVYFRCVAQGDPDPSGDGARNASWRGVPELRRLLEEVPGSFSWVDRAGLRLYVAEVMGAGRPGSAPG